VSVCAPRRNQLSSLSGTDLLPLLGKHSTELSIRFECPPQLPELVLLFVGPVVLVLRTLLDSLNQLVRSQDSLQGRTEQLVGLDRAAAHKVGIRTNQRGLR